MPDDQPPLCQGWHDGHPCRQPVLPDNGRIIHPECWPTLHESIAEFLERVPGAALKSLETYARDSRRTAQAARGRLSEAASHGLWPPGSDELQPPF